MKTMAIRLDEQLHAQLVLLSQIGGTTIADEVRQAIEAHVAKKGSESDLAAQAELALAQFDKESANRRKAIEALLEGKSGSQSVTRIPRKSGSRGDKK